MRKANIFILLLPLILCCLFSCNNLSDVLLESNALIEESADKQSAKLYINLHGIERTILPSEDDISMLTNFTLSGKIKGENEVVLGKWENIEMLQNKQIALKPGDWELNLTAYKYSLKYSGKNDVVLYKGDNQVSFDLMRIDSDGIDGSLDFTLDFSRAEKPENVALAIAHIEKIDGTILYENKELEIVDNSVNYTEFSIPAGTYRLCVTLYADLDGKIILANYKEILKIASSLVSQKTYKLNSFKNLYHINYHFNDTEAYPASFVENVPEIFIASTGKIALQSPERAGGWSFNGWYLDKSRTLPVTEIDSSCISDVDVYADWDFDIDLGIGCYTSHHGDIFLYDSEKKTNYTKHDSFVKLNPNVYEYYVDYCNFSGYKLLDIQYEKYELDPSIQVTVINETLSLQDSTEDDIIITATAPDNRSKVFKIHATPVYDCKSKLQFMTDGVYYSSHKDASKIEFLGKKGDYDWFLFSCTDAIYKVYSADVNSIEESTFSGYNVLEEIDIPDSIKSIGKNAFSGCTNLKKINYLGTLRDWCCIEFESTTANPMGIGANLYIDEALVKEIVIPEDIEKISNFAFCGYSVLESVIIPNNVKEIGECAFKASGIKSIAIPGSVREIGEQAFSNCKNLSQVVIADGVETIGRDAFHSTEIKSIEIPGSVKTISGAAFRNCNSLNQVILHEGTESIENQAFSGTAITNVKLPSSITYLGSGGSYSNPFAGIESAIISDGATNICDNAFSGCTKLIHVEIPDSVTEIGQSAFCDCSTLSEITLSKEIKTIGKRTFAGCSNLHDLIIPEGCTIISDYAFRGSNIQNITIPQSVISIGKDVFENCQIGCMRLLSKSGLRIVQTLSMDSLILGGEITEITDGFFKGKSGISSITLLDCVKEVGANAFADSTINKLIINRSEIQFKEKAFYSSKISSVYYSGNLEDWLLVEFSDLYSNPLCNGAKLYLNDAELKELIIPNNVSEIGQYAFYGCKSVESITGSTNIQKIGKYAFYKCENLKTILLPESVKEVGKEAFNYCSNLGSVTISGKDIKIECDFYGCSKLNSVIFTGTIDDWLTMDLPNSFLRGKSETALYVDNCNVETFTTLTIPNGATRVSALNKFKNLEEITIPDTVETIGDHAFSGCEKLKTIKFSENLTSIGSEVFRNCKAINQLTLPETVKTIGDCAFAGCESLRSISISDNLESIGRSAFLNCKNLRRFEVPASVTVLKESIFEGCTCLTNIIIHDGLQKIESRVFVGLNITELSIPEACTSIESGIFYGCNQIAQINFNGTKAQWYSATHDQPLLGIENKFFKVICKDGYFRF